MNLDLALVLAELRWDERQSQPTIDLRFALTGEAKAPFPGQALEMLHVGLGACRPQQRGRVR